MLALAQGSDRLRPNLGKSFEPGSGTSTVRVLQFAFLVLFYKTAAVKAGGF